MALISPTEAMINLSLSLAAFQKSGSRDAPYGHSSGSVAGGKVTQKQLDAVKFEVIGEDGFVINPGQKLLVLNGNTADGASAGSIICWLYVPEVEDSVLVNLWYKKLKETEILNDCRLEPGVISYIGNYSVDMENRKMRKGSRLPKGLFFWKSDLAGKAVGIEKIITVRAQPKGIEYHFQKGRNGNPDTYVSGKIMFTPQDDPHPSDSVRAWAYSNILDRNQAFENVMCMSELQFRGKVGAIAKLPENGVSKAFFRENFTNSGAILVTSCMDTFSALPVRQLRSKYIGFAGVRPKVVGSLVILKRSQRPKEADIRYLQSHFKGAVFQLASTPNCLEGGLQNYTMMLDDMNRTPVQGEDASLGTMPAVIVRRYFVPAAERNLFSELGFIFNIDSDPHITLKSRKITAITCTTDGKDQYFEKDCSNNKYLFDLAVSGYVQVGIHRNIPVTSGLLEPDIRIPRKTGYFFSKNPKDQRSLPAFDKRITEPSEMRVHHIITSAVHLNGPNDTRAADARLILAGMYEGTILAAWDVLYGEKGGVQKYTKRATDIETYLTEGPESESYARLFLTLVGGSAFKNDPRWILDILTNLAYLIRRSGLQICLVLWDDMMQNDDLVKAFENLAAVINGTEDIKGAMQWKDSGTINLPFDNDLAMKINNHDIEFIPVL